MSQIYQDRVEAGRLLAAELVRFRHPDTLVLGVPRGGVVVAAEVARALEAPLDVVIARKIGAPYQPELAIGAVISGDHLRLLDEKTIRYLGVPPAYIERETEIQLEEISRRLKLYRGDRALPNVTGKHVIVVDDGIATGYTLRAALAGLRHQQPAELIVAVPVAPVSTLDEMRRYADEVVCLETPEPFIAVGAWYDNFDQTSDAEVTHLLARDGAT